MNELKTDILGPILTGLRFRPKSFYIRESQEYDYELN